LGRPVLKSHNPAGPPERYFDRDGIPGEPVANLGFLRDHSHHFFARGVDQNYLALDHGGFEPRGLRNEVSDGRRYGREDYAIWHQRANRCPKARWGGIILRLADTLIDGLFLGSRQIDM
jgi:hypothetical protein